MGVICFFSNGIVHNKLELLNEYVYNFVATGRSWSEIYGISKATTWGSISLTCIIITPSIIIFLNFKNCDPDYVINSIIGITILILILGPTFSVMYRLLLIPYLLLTLVKIKSLPALFIKSLMTLYNLLHFVLKINFSI